MEVLEIRGTRDAMFTMRLNMANCFPCSVTWLRKLLKKAIDVSDDPQLYRAELATMKKIQRSEYGRSYAAIKALKNMEKDKKNLLECLVVLGQGGETDETIAG